jgi:GNAT superfamily N-acetyltransferase
MRVVHEIAERHLPDLVELLRSAWWSADRTEGEVRRMLAGTPAVVGLLDQDERLVAFARAISDGVYRAYVHDVVVRADRQRRGLGSQVFEALLEHPLVAGVEKVELQSLPEHLPLYRRYGFRDGADALVRMVRRGPVVKAT